MKLGSNIIYYESVLFALSRAPTPRSSTRYELLRNPPFPHVETSPREITFATKKQKLEVYLKTFFYVTIASGT